MKDLYEDSTDWRIEKVIHIKSQVNSDGITDDFVEMIEDISDSKCAQLSQSAPKLIKCFKSGEDFDKDDIAEFFFGNLDMQSGLFVQVAAQCPNYHDLKSWSCGWGYYQTEWIYVQDIREAEEYAAQLSEDLHESAKSKFVK